MDFVLPEDKLELRRAIREFVDNELIPLEADLGDGDPDEMPERFVKPIHDKMKAANLWALPVPEEFGGRGLDTLGMVVAREEQCRSTFNKWIWGGNANPLLYDANDYIKEKYLFPTIKGEKLAISALSEPNAGGDLAGVEAYYERKGDDYIINGIKTWHNGAGQCDYMFVLARAKGTKRREGLTWFVVDKGTAGFEPTRLITNMGYHTTWETRFTDCVVPEVNRLTPEGEAWTFTQTRLSNSRLNNSAECLGMAVRCQEFAIPYSKQRITFGQPLASRQAIQFMLADSEIEMYATRSMLYQAAGKADRGEDIRSEVSMIKIFATEMASRVIDRSLQIHGALGYSKDLPLERFYRDVRAYRIFEGPSEVHKYVVARNLLRDS